MGRPPLHSQRFHYRASLRFTAWSAASAPAPLPAACQAPIQTLARAGRHGHAWRWEQHISGICSRDMLGAGALQGADSAPLFSFNQQLSRLQKGWPAAAWGVSFTQGSDCSPGLHQQGVPEWGGHHLIHLGYMTCSPN